MTTAADKLVTLPTTRLILAAWLGALVVGVGWAGLAAVITDDRLQTLVGLVATGVVGVAATLALLAIRPWKPKAIASWPIIWVAGSFGRLGCTLAGALLLYSATPLRSPSLWLAVMVAYLAALIGETRVYVHCMQRLGAPVSPGDGVGPQPPEPTPAAAVKGQLE